MFDGATRGFFGKLPAAGDFVSRGLPRPLIAKLDAWLHDGMAAMPKTVGADWLDYYLVAPAWSFILPAGTWCDDILLGALIPSVDRVGRYFPLAALHVCAADTPSSAYLPPASDWHDATRAVLLRALRQALPPDRLMAELPVLDGARLDSVAMASADGDIFSILGSDTDAEITLSGAQVKRGLAWPDLPVLFEARADRSYWWAEATAAQAARRALHRGMPDSALFGALFGPRGNHVESP